MAQRILPGDATSCVQELGLETLNKNTGNGSRDGQDEQTPVPDQGANSR